MLSDFPGSKSLRPEEEKEWTEYWTAIDLHSVIFNSVTPAGIGSSHCVNIEALHALVLLLLSVPLEVPLTRSMVAWDPWFHQKKFIWTSSKLPCPPFLARMAQWDSAATWLMAAADYWCCVYDLHVAQHIRKPILSHHASTCLHLCSVHNIKNAEEELSAIDGTFLKAPQACLRKSKRELLQQSVLWRSLMCWRFLLWASIVGSIHKCSFLCPISECSYWFQPCTDSHRTLPALKNM